MKSRVLYLSIGLLFCLPFIYGYKRNVGILEKSKIDETPFQLEPPSRGISAHTNINGRRNFFDLFNVPYIICFFAANGKWPFIPSMLKVKVDEVSRSIFVQDESYIQNYCRGKFSFRHSYRPQITVTPRPIVKTTVCTCGAAFKVEPTLPTAYFDKDHIGNVSANTIENTIEFLESFLPTAPEVVNKKTKKKTKILINVSN